MEIKLISLSFNKVGSALSDPYLSFAASMNGLAGPLHGLANQVRFWKILNFNNFILIFKIKGSFGLDSKINFNFRWKSNWWTS